jgi:endonuclease III
MTAQKKSLQPKQTERVSKILTGLEQRYPEATCALEHRNALELLIATILSAQCTDERVNIVTRDLFRKYRKPGDYGSVAPEELESDIRSTGFYRNKAKSIQRACRMILDRFGGKVPETMADLIQLPGVARKTANVVLGVIFRKAEGIVVDTHVTRLAGRLGLSAEQDPGKIEADLLRLIPRDKWIKFSHQLILHGRQVCKARKPLCLECMLLDVCESGDKQQM